MKREVRKNNTIFLLGELTCKHRVLCFYSSAVLVVQFSAPNQTHSPIRNPLEAYIKDNKQE